MSYLIQNTTAFIDGQMRPSDILIEKGEITAIGAEIVPTQGQKILDFAGCYLFPGLVDVHVHLREPGFLYKETILSGSKAAARGGFTTVCSMPNLNPVPDCSANLQVQLDAIRRDAVVRVLPYAAISKGELGKELVDFAALAGDVVAFSDDGKGVQDEQMMRQAMLAAKGLGKIIAAHCEDETLVHGGCIHQSLYAERRGHRGISSASEWKQVQRDLQLAEQTGCAYHVCHVSTKESVQLMREAKARGVNASCETAAHYVLLSSLDMQEDGRFKMNPPLRDEEDRLAIIEGLLDGTIDMIASDHAPHSAEEKSRGLADSLMGVVGLETSFPVLYSGLVKKGIISLPQLLELMQVNPSRRFGIGSSIAVGQPADLTVFELDTAYELNPDDFLSLGRSTPFAWRKVYGKCLLTMCGGKIAWQEGRC